MNLTPLSRRLSVLHREQVDTARVLEALRRQAARGRGKP